MISINDFLDYIFAEFKGYLRSDPQLCHLKDVHYDAGKVPDYSDLHVQQLYLLRYAYAYAFEYKCMYKHLPRYMFDQPSLSIMSIGCGNMIDYWAIAQLVDPQVTLQYRGFDSVNWFNKFVAREQDQVLFTLGDAITAIEDMAVIPADVIVFPKSISEFDHEAIDRICQCVREKMILKDKVCVLVSLRADQGSVQRDMEKTSKIYNAFCDAGFSTESRSDTIIHFADHSKKIRELDHAFAHPGDVVDLLKELHTWCAEYKENGINCRQSCLDRLDRWPMLSCKHMQWQMFEFVREEG